MGTVNREEQTDVRATRRRKVTVCCPTCGETFDLAELRRPGGITERPLCPRCEQQVRIVLPYGRAAAILSLLIAFAAMAFLHVRTIPAFIAGTVLIWIPLSLFLNVASTRLRPPTLKKPKPRSVTKPRRRTFFEWLYDRDAPPELFGKPRR